jgi:NAD(P)-dependent dehydrogenase (short-subunit alcohol dehydrogenase family)
MQTRPPRLDAKVAIVTGCGGSDRWPGTGRASAILFAREGAKLVLVDRDPLALEETRARIAKEGGQALAVEADLTRSADCQRAVASAVAQHGRLDVLVNNMGIVYPPGRSGGNVVDVDEDTWDQVIAANLKSAMLMSRYAVPAMIASGEPLA